MLDSEASEPGLTNEEREAIALALKRATIAIRQKRSGWLREDSFRPYSGRKELDTKRCTEDCSEFALSVFRSAAEIFTAKFSSSDELEPWLQNQVSAICAKIKAIAREMPVDLSAQFEVEVFPRIQEALNSEADAILLRFLDGEARTLRLRSSQVADRLGAQNSLSSQTRGDGPEQLMGSFSGEHKAQFQQLLSVGEVYALNIHPEYLALGPWTLGSDVRGDDAAERLHTRFEAAVRKAARAAGAPARVNLLSWWIGRLAGTS